MKKLFLLITAILIIATLLFTPTSIISSANTKPKLYHNGDISLDGNVNGMDLLLIKQHILGVNGKELTGTPAFNTADMNEDGAINGMDLLLLKKVILGSIKYYPFTKLLTFDTVTQGKLIEIDSKHKYFIYVYDHSITGNISSFTVYCEYLESKGFYVFDYEFKDHPNGEWKYTTYTWAHDDFNDYDYLLSISAQYDYNEVWIIPPYADIGVYY